MVTARDSTSVRDCTSVRVVLLIEIICRISWPSWEIAFIFIKISLVRTNVIGMLVADFSKSVPKVPKSGGQNLVQKFHRPKSESDKIEKITLSFEGILNSVQKIQSHLKKSSPADIINRITKSNQIKYVFVINNIAGGSKVAWTIPKLPPPPPPPPIYRGYKV